MIEQTVRLDSRVIERRYFEGFAEECRFKYTPKEPNAWDKNGNPEVEIEIKNVYYR